MNTPRLSKIELAVLEMLVAQGEMYGLEMIAANNSLKRGTIYVTLNRMVEKGYVAARTAETVAGEQGPQRRKYRPTGLGQRVLQALRAADAAFGGKLAGEGSYVR